MKISKQLLDQNNKMIDDLNPNPDRQNFFKIFFLVFAFVGINYFHSFSQNFVQVLFSKYNLPTIQDYGIKGFVDSFSENSFYIKDSIVLDASNKINSGYLSRHSTSTSYKFDEIGRCISIFKPKNDDSLVFIYNSNGDSLKKISYGKSKMNYSRIKYEQLITLSETGKILSLTNKNSDGEKRAYLTYSEEDNLIKVEEFSIDGDLFTKAEISYNKNNQPIEIKCYEKQENQEATYKLKYINKDSVEISFVKSGSIQNIRCIKYDEMGNSIKEKLFNDKMVLLHEYFNVFDDNKLLIDRKYLIYSSEQLPLVNYDRWKYELDKNNNWISQLNIGKDEYYLKIRVIKY